MASNIVMYEWILLNKSDIIWMQHWVDLFFIKRTLFLSVIYANIQVIYRTAIFYMRHLTFTRFKGTLSKSTLFHGDPGNKNTTKFCCATHFVSGLAFGNFCIYSTEFRYKRLFMSFSEICRNKTELCQINCSYMKCTKVNRRLTQHYQVFSKWKAASVMRLRPMLNDRPFRRRCRRRPILGSRKVDNSRFLLLDCFQFAFTDRCSRSFSFCAQGGSGSLTSSMAIATAATPLHSPSHRYHL